MPVCIDVVVGDDEPLRDLFRWLREDLDVANYAAVTLAPSVPADGAMGAVEIINLVVGQGFTALNLALSYASWRAARPDAPTVVIRVGDASLAVADDSAETLRAIVTLLEDRSSRRTGTETPGRQSRTTGETA
ncbi:effector-associated constant component EACC1 [Streptomyces sp. CA-249302]|uniref:effector-associated constant component EACC1 n=1 Tax=Streptomyces sp. CA-249302 TaxID=3240058 RepID=UPI003D8D514D